MGIVFIVDGEPPQIDFRDSATSTSDTDSYSQAGMSFGSADATRYILVGFVYFGIGSINSQTCTIGGVSATRLIRQTQDSEATGRAGVAIYVAAVPTGTSGTVVHNLSANAAAHGMVVYRVTNWAGANFVTDTDDIDPIDMNVAHPANAVVMAVATAVNDFTSDPGVSAVWSGLTQDEDTNFESSTVLLTSASDSFETADASLDIECSTNATSSLHLGCVVALYN